MCRWLAYLGSPIPIGDVLLKPNHSLIDQSLVARELYVPCAGTSPVRYRPEPTNGDGFGIAWQGRAGIMAQYRQTSPAWDSQNLRHLAVQIESGCFFAHVRSAPGGSISDQNCHPFVHDGWAFQHNGEIRDFAVVKRELTFDVDPQLYPYILGSTDSEVCFFLALTYGLASDPVAAFNRMVTRVERARKEHQLAESFRATMCASDGDRLVVLRWVSPDASDERAPSLFHSTGAQSLRAIDGSATFLPEDAQLVVSEPLELHWSRRTWRAIPDGTISVFETGREPVFSPVELAA